MSKREEFITFLNELKIVSRTISDEQRKGLLQRAVQHHNLSVAEATEILGTSGLVVGENVNYFEILNLSIEDLHNLNESDIKARVETSHKKLYTASLMAGGRPRSDGRTEEQWRTLLNQARDALKEPQNRRAHLATFQHGEDFIDEPPVPLYLDNMELIPAGEFQMGSNDDESFSDEHPIHTVFLNAFYIDKYPVTNAQYKAFVDANPQWSKPRGFIKFIPARYHDDYYLLHWNKNYYPESKADHPVVHISWYAAMAYAEWIGKRLPTESEWEKAARGGLAGQKYPWGNLIDTDMANFAKNVGQTTSIGEYPANGYDLYDMAGNVWEWCLDKWDNGFYESSPSTNPISGDSVDSIMDNFTKFETSRVLRGGSWYNTAENVRVTKRSGAPPEYTNANIGFRCVQSISP